MPKDMAKNDLEGELSMVVQISEQSNFLMPYSSRHNSFHSSRHNSRRESTNEMRDLVVSEIYTVIKI